MGDWEDCWNCFGTGHILTQTEEGEQEYDCHICHGLGEIEIDGDQHITVSVVAE